jgi:two-component system sensor histidine kinase/response regulator
MPISHPPSTDGIVSEIAGPIRLPSAALMPVAMKTLLVIDDDEAILSSYGLALEHAGYRVHTATSGTVGVELARRHLPDLILCDINMPGMDGRNVLRTLREDTLAGATQIVLMTGNTQGLNTREAMALGADDFLTKPFGVVQLMRCVEARLQRAQIHGRVADQAVTDLRASLRSSLPHELFTPLAGILGLTAALRTDLPQMSPAEINELLADIERSGWRLHRTLKNYLAVLDLEHGPAPETAPPVLAGDNTQAAVANGAATAVRRHAREADLAVEAAPALLAVDAGDMTVMVEELVDNACSFSRPGTPIAVRLDEHGRMQVTDRGRGMTPAQIAQIGAFRQFDRQKHEQQGLGLGLVLVRKLAIRCGATFSLASEPGSGTTATVTFRIAEI